MRMISVVCGVVVAAAVCSGCLRKEVTQTVYLGPSGVVWSVIERDVRSDEKAPADRIREEQDYFLAASAGKHGVAEAFRALGAQSVTTTWLRRERPYSVMTEGRFADLRQLTMAMLRDAQAHGDVSLVREGCQTRFTVRVGSPPVELIVREPVTASLPSTVGGDRRQRTGEGLPQICGSCLDGIGCSAIRSPQ